MKDVIILAGGSSVEDGLVSGLFDKIKGREVWSLNFSWKVMPFLPKRQCWVDTTFWRNNIKDLENLNKQGVECHCKRNDRYNGIPDIIQHDATRKPEKLDTMLYMGSMGMCGMFSLSLAIKEGYERIFLLGYDFGTLNGSTHTHFYQGMSGISYQSNGVGKPSVYLENHNSPKKDVREFDLYKDYKTIYNVSTRSHIATFPKISYEEFYKLLEEGKDG